MERTREMDIESKLDKISQQLMDLSADIKIMTHKQNILSAKVEEMSVMVHRHERKLTILEAENGQRSKFIGWFSKNWMPVLIAIGVIGEIIHQIKSVKGF